MELPLFNIKVLYGNQTQPYQPLIDIQFELSINNYYDNYYYEYYCYDQSS